MRQSMLCSGLESLSYNINRKSTDLKFFEFGKTYHKFNSDYKELKHLSLFLTGFKFSKSWTRPKETTSFFELKGVISSVFEKLGITDLSFHTVESSLFSEGLMGKVKDKTIVEFGRVTPYILKSFDIEQEVLYADVLWDAVLEVIQNHQLEIKDIPKYPSAQRDFALLLDKSVKFDDLKTSAFKIDKNILKEIDLFDVYEGDKLPEEKKSYALRFKFMDEEKTLTDKQVDKVMSKLQNRFETEFGASLR
jgi:phenylalanyl-tRNA synthetase beta chain